MYSQQEIEMIKSIAKGKALSREQWDILTKEFAGKDVPFHMQPFIGLFAVDKDLYNKIAEDDRVKKFSIYGFFPKAIDLVYGSETSPEIRYIQDRNRGITVEISHPSEKFLIKPALNSREREIAQIAGDLKVGPHQYETLDNFLTEQVFEGDLFSRLPKIKTSNASIYFIGRRMGYILRSLHLKEIYYNEITLSDDFANSNLIVPQDPFESILGDYRVALRLDMHPNYSEEEIFNYARTLPGVNDSLDLMLSGLNEGLQQKTINEKEAREAFERYKIQMAAEFMPIVQSSTKQEIMARDVQFINEGLVFASHRLGNYILEPFSKGFRETYFGTK